MILELKMSWLGVKIGWNKQRNESHSAFEELAPKMYFKTFVAFTFSAESFFRAEGPGVGGWGGGAGLLLGRWRRGGRERDWWWRINWNRPEIFVRPSRCLSWFSLKSAPAHERPLASDNNGQEKRYKRERPQWNGTLNINQNINHKINVDQQIIEK